MTNVEQLESAGVLDAASLSQEQKDTINGLSAAEVAHLIAVRGKVGDYSESNHPGGRPWVL